MVDGLRAEVEGEKFLIQIPSTLMDLLGKDLVEKDHRVRVLGKP